MNKIIAYDTVKAHSVRYIVEKVNKRIIDGWQPFGSITMTTSGISRNGGTTGIEYCQIVVKYEEPVTFHDDHSTDVIDYSKTKRS